MLCGDWIASVKFSLPERLHLQEDEEDEEDQEDQEDEEDQEYPPLRLAPDRNEGKPVSRNAPCPCGSGKKYKRCCLGREA